MLTKEEKEFRKNVIRALRLANSVYFNETSRNLKISDIDSFISLLNYRRKEFSKDIFKENYIELISSYIALLACSKLSIGLISSIKSKVKIFPLDFILEDNLPEPNFAFGTLFTLISNELLSIVNLILDGMEYPARPLIRSLNELCMLSIVLLSDPDKRKIYYSSQNFEDDRKNWYKYFTPAKLNDSILGLKNNFDLEQQIIINEYYNCNKHAQELYSQSTHSTYINNFLGAYPNNIYDDNTRIYSIFGYPSKSAKNTLFYLFEFIHFTLSSVRLIIERQLNLKFPSVVEFNEFLVLEDIMYICMAHLYSKFKTA